jgi:hypothetical protein
MGTEFAENFEEASMLEERDQASERGLEKPNEAQKKLKWPAAFELPAVCLRYA